MAAPALIFHVFDEKNINSKQIVDDVLITKLMRILRRDEVVAVFADDIAIDLEYFWIAAPALHVTFSEIQKISALTLNIENTVMIPLLSFSSGDTGQRLMQKLCLGLRDLEIEQKGKHLGFVLGTNVLLDGWAKAFSSRR